MVFTTLKNLRRTRRKSEFLLWSLAPQNQWGKVQIFVSNLPRRPGKGKRDIFTEAVFSLQYQVF